MTNSIEKKYIFHVRVKLISPVCVSNGEDNITDKDVIKDYDGIPFIPGSSLAGAMRAYLNAESNVKCIFGHKETYENAGDDRMSSVYVSDLRFADDTVITVRDSVKLTEDKTAETNAKFDMEIVDPGVSGDFSLELVVRKHDNEAGMLNEIKTIFYGLENGEIRFGTKKTRGYGEVSLESVKVKCYDKSNIWEYAKAYDPAVIAALDNKKNDWIGKAISKYMSITMPLELEGCISIRQYSAKKNLPDYVHITANGYPVVPGTSMTGAIRHRISDILRLDLGISGKRFVDEMFGYVIQGKQKTDAERSRVIVGEAVIHNSTPLTIVRNGISRFEAGTKDGALFKELSYQGGKTELSILIEKGSHDMAMAGLILLALADLDNGYLAVGGQTSVGKGIFKAAGDILINDEPFDISEYLKAASKWINGGEN